MWFIVINGAPAANRMFAAGASNETEKAKSFCLKTLKSVNIKLQE
jgi:hypothetical protein